MSSTDFVNGRMAANFAHRREMADADEAIGEWKAYSQKLEFDFVKAESGRIGFAHLCKTLVEELTRLDPNNPLLQKETRLRIVETKAAEKATEMGYVFDAVSGRLIGKR